MEQNFLIGGLIKDFDRIPPFYILIMPVLEYDESIVIMDFAEVRKWDFHGISCRTRIIGFQSPFERELAPS